MLAKRRAVPPAALALAVLLMVGSGGTWAAIQNLDDGAMQDPNGGGGWVMPDKGSCPMDPNQLTRPDCLAQRYPSFTTSAACTAGGIRSFSTGVCNDTDLTHQTEATCNATPGRLWSNGVCAVTMKGYNRNKAVCTLQLGGTWVVPSVGFLGTCTGTWVMPNSSTFTPPLFTSVTNPGPGDQCLRCHRTDTEWNTNRVRDVDSYLMTGHKNMARKVMSPYHAWSGPDGANYHSDDAGNLFNWGAGTVSIGGLDKPLYWIFGDWLGPLPRAIYATGPGTTRVCSDPTKTTEAACLAASESWILAPGVSYSCARCHTTNWTSDSTINALKEPEKSFPGITWNRTADATTGAVNLSGNVSGDTNKYGSWDLYGITCARCHASAVENSAGGSCSVANLFTSGSCVAGGGTWTAGLPYPAPLGKGTTHHADVTNFDGVNGGYCSDLTLRNATKLTCEYYGATWYSQCSDPLWPTEGQCKATSGCSNPAFTTSATCIAGGQCSLPFFSTSAACAAGGGVWTSPNVWSAKTAGTWQLSYCSIGSCSNALYTSFPTCTSNGGIWTNTWTDLFSCMDAGGKWTGTKTRRGQLITSLCVQCHRQETGGLPYDAGNPAGVLKVGPAHGTVAFVSHPHGNQFLNSPHGKFTGTFSQIGSATFGTGYNSYFQFDGEAANTGNGCTGCHDPHKSIVKAAGTPGAIHEECTECHAKNLGTILHPKGFGTPLENMIADPAEACISCHMPEGMHLYRINSDPNYATFPPTALTATVNANTAADGSYTNAVWVDVDHACGKCHGGGNLELPGPAHSVLGTIASITPSANAKILTVASKTGFAAGQRVSIAGAGALEEDGLTREDFETYIVSVDPNSNTINLAGGASKAVTNVTVIQNPTKNGGAYLTKAELAVYAKGIHDDKPVASFGYMIGSPNTSMISVDASASTCSGSSASCDAYDWDWGDGTAAGSGVTASHLYADPNSYTITLTVEQYGVNSDTVSQVVTAYAFDAPPVASGLCSFDANTWTLTLTDSSMDDNPPLKLVSVKWGEPSTVVDDKIAPFGPFVRTYNNVGPWTVTQTAVDSIGQADTETCVVSPAYFTIGGTVSNNAGTVQLANATIKVKKGSSLVRTVFTGPTGVFSVGSLKPGTYTLTVTKTGYTFPVPAATITVGGNSAGNDIRAN